MTLTVPLTAGPSSSEVIKKQLNLYGLGVLLQNVQMQLPLQLMQFSYLLNHDHIICHREFLVQMGLNSSL